MNCPLCGAQLRVIKTYQVSNALARRTRQCENALCPYVDRTYEMLNCDKNDLLIDELFALILDVAKTLGPGCVKDRLARLACEVSKLN